jgi:hypothetical protein
MEHRKPGRKSKGDRKQVNFYLPASLHAAAQAAAAERGMTFTDLMGELIAEELGAPYQTQEALSLSA